jgi:hypothetical protein
MKLLAIAVMLIAVFAVVRSNSVRQQRSALAEVARFDARVTYDYQVQGATRPPGPNWLLRLLGEDFFAEVVGIEIDADRVDENALAAIASLPQLKFLSLQAEGLNDQHVARFTERGQLDRLTFQSATVTDSGLAQLSQLRGLSYLSIVAPRITDAGLVLLAEMPNLTFVELISTDVTAEGVERLRAALPNCDVHVYPVPRPRL